MRSCGTRKVGRRESSSKALGGHSDQLMGHWVSCTAEASICQSHTPRTRPASNRPAPPSAVHYLPVRPFTHLCSGDRHWLGSLLRRLGGAEVSRQLPSPLEAVLGIPWGNHIPFPHSHSQPGPSLGSACGRLCPRQPLPVAPKGAVVVLGTPVRDSPRPPSHSSSRGSRWVEFWGGPYPRLCGNLGDARWEL